MVTLCPSQQEAFDELLEELDIGNVFVVWTPTGKGKTTMLRELHRLRGGAFLSMKTYIEEIATREPFQMEEALERILMNAMDRNEYIILDDLHLLYQVMCGCGYGDAYPRAKFLDAILTSVCTFAVASGKKLVFGNDGNVASAVSSRCFYAGFKKFTAADYEFLGRLYLDENKEAVKFDKIYQFAPKLNAHQLRSSCSWFAKREVDTEIFIDYLRKQRMASNVDLAEVEAVDLHTLKGMDDVIESLEANIIVPLEENALAAEYNIQPKRGVLLAGPPGTGKTTVGRALAHRLRSKFFLIDGTIISGSRDFYSQVHQIFEAAKNNAPAIIFIDDSDVIFENKDDFGLYRYLLTMLDGLESESNKRVCVMMTTMDVGSIPPALVRSGRIELWLETRLPDVAARLAILEAHTSGLPADLKSVDVEQLSKETEGLTGADLRRLIDDGKILFAFDKARKKETKGIDTYFLRAIEIIRSNKEKYAQAERARPAIPPANAFARYMASAMSRNIDDSDD
jgi:ATP-dependent 26S proteasome regulatory subunit